MKIVKKSILLSIVFVITGCATPAPDVSTPQQKKVIDVGEISISNLTTPTEKNESGGWTTGFIKLADENTNPPFSILVFDSIKTNLTAAKGMSSELLDLIVLRADLLMEMRTADSIPFVGIASVLSDRKYACRVEINFKQGSTNERKIFEGKAVYNRSWFDMDITRKREFIEFCLKEIVNDVATAANDFIKK